MSDKKETLRKVKDKASKAFADGKLKDALKLFSEVVEGDPTEIGCFMKVGDIHRRLGNGAQAIAAYEPVVRHYAADGLLLKAVAVCKLILSVDPRHTATQEMLADLITKRSTPATSSRPGAAAQTPRPSGPAQRGLDLAMTTASMEIDRGHQDYSHLHGSALPAGASVDSQGVAIIRGAPMSSPPIVGGQKIEPAVIRGEAARDDGPPPPAWQPTGAPPEAGWFLPTSGDAPPPPAWPAPQAAAPGAPPPSAWPAPEAAAPGAPPLPAWPTTGTFQALPDAAPSPPPAPTIPPAFVTGSWPVAVPRAPTPALESPPSAPGPAVVDPVSFGGDISNTPSAPGPAAVDPVAFGGDISNTPSAPQTDAAGAASTPLSGAVVEAVAVAASAAPTPGTLDSLDDIEVSEDIESEPIELNMVRRPEARAGSLEVVSVPQIPLFSDLPRSAFIDILVEMTMREMKPGEAVIREGELGDSFFVIVSGKVRITRQQPGGKEVVLAYLTDGAFFGEMAILQDAVRTASVIVEEDSQIFEIKKELLDSLTKAHPSVDRVLRNFYMQRLLSTSMATHPLFRPFSGEERRNLMQKFRSREFTAGSVLVHEGKRGEGLYILLTGALDVTKLRDGNPVAIATLTTGDLFGEMSLLMGRPTMATVTAARDSLVLRLGKADFDQLIMTHPQVLELVAKISQERELENLAVFQDFPTQEPEGAALV